MTYLRWSFLTLLGVCALVLIVACGGSDDKSTQTPSATAKLTREEAERQAGFTFLIPTYLPAKVNPEPQYIVFGGKRGIDVRYSSAGDGKEAESPTIYVHEQNEGELIPNVSPVLETIKGTSVQVSEVSAGDPVPGATADVTGVWSQGELKLSVEVIWGLNSTPVVLTDEMRTEARKVIESIISQQPSP